MTRDCVICGATFVPRNPKRPALTCSLTCRNKLQWQRVPNRDCGPKAAERATRTCEFCGKDFISGAHLGRANVARFCSRTCTGRAKAKDGFNYSGGRLRVTLRDGSRQLYSRCLMEGHLERDLSYDEVVHHVNGDPTDDRIENLRVMPRAEHTSMHSTAFWAEQSILRAQGRA